MPLGQFAIAALVGLGPTYGNLPLHFEANHGQTDSRVKFLARGHGYTLFLTASEAVLAGAHAVTDPSRGGALRMQFLSAASSPAVSGHEELSGRSHYLIGNDPTRWRTHVPTYGRVEYREIYPGIDLVFYGREGELEYDFVVAPGADPLTIRLRFENAERLELDAQGDLLLRTSAGLVRQHKPTAYQEVNGKRKLVPTEFELGENHEVGFLVAAHDASRPLIIDPVLAYSTYLGGNGVDSSRAVAVDGAGSAYVTGTTNSTNFPVAGDPLQATYGGGATDAFVAKLNPAGSALVYATYLGGSGDEQANALAIDDAGQVYLTGFTSSGNFPTRNPVQATFGGPPIDAFVTKLTANGDALVFSTYLGGVALDVGNGITVDRFGQAYLSARTGSANLPTTPGTFQPVFAGAEDAFVAKFKADGTQIEYLTYLGGIGIDIGRRIAVDHAGRAYISGRTSSINFPTTPRAVQTTFAGGPSDAFVTKLNAAGSALVYSTYLGGTGDDEGSGIALHGDGQVYTVGWTGSLDFPTTRGAFQRTYGGGVFDVFVANLNEQGSRLAYSTYLGGSGTEMSFFGLAVDHAGRAHVTGPTGSIDFPVARPLEGGGALRGPSDAFVTKLNTSGSRLVFSSYLGGSGTEGAQGIAVDRSGNVYVAGTTASTDFPTTEGAFQTTFAGGPNDAFVVKISDRHGHGHDGEDDEEKDNDPD
jgi:beta-propeller repeat-containing protein